VKKKIVKIHKTIQYQKTKQKIFRCLYIKVLRTTTYFKEDHQIIVVCDQVLYIVILKISLNWKSSMFYMTSCNGMSNYEYIKF